VPYLRIPSRTANQAARAALGGPMTRQEAKLTQTKEAAVGPASFHRWHTRTRVARSQNRLLSVVDGAARRDTGSGGDPSSSGTSVVRIEAAAAKDEIEAALEFARQFDGDRFAILQCGRHVEGVDLAVTSGGNRSKCACAPCCWQTCQKMRTMVHIRLPLCLARGCLVRSA